MCGTLPTALRSRDEACQKACQCHIPSQQLEHLAVPHALAPVSAGTLGIPQLLEWHLGPALAALLWLSKPEYHRSMSVPVFTVVYYVRRDAWHSAAAGVGSGRCPGGAGCRAQRYRAGPAAVAQSSGVRCAHPQPIWQPAGKCPVPPSLIIPFCTHVMACDTPKCHDAAGCCAAGRQTSDRVLQFAGRQIISHHAAHI